MAKWSRFNYLPNIPLREDGKKVTSSKEHIEISKNAAKEGMVLLKNDNNVLPLSYGKRVVLFGKGTFDYVKGGGGSGDTTVSYVRNIYEGFKKLGNQVEIYEPVADYYRKNVEKQYKDKVSPGMTVEPEVPKELLDAARMFSDTAIISICRFSAEGSDISDDRFYLSDEEAAMVDSVKEVFDHCIVVLNIGSMIDTSWFANDDLIEGAFIMWQAGMEGGLAAAELLTGISNPSGKLADSFAEKLTDYPSTEGFHKSEDFVEYVEDIYVGYRYFETIPGAKEKIVYPFGYGLSYTTFKVTTNEINVNEEDISFEVAVTNTGAVAGKEIVQLYYGAPQGKLGKAVKSLGDFVKTRLLSPGETQLVTLSINIEEMASYDDLGKISKASYILEKGEYSFYIGTSVEDVDALAYKYIVDEDIIVKTLNSRLVPTDLPERMLADGTYEKLPMGESNNPRESALEELPQEVWGGATPVGHLNDGHSLWASYEERRIIPLSNVFEAKNTIEEFIAQLSDEQLCDMVGGQPNTGIANTFGIGNLTDFGVPNTMTADGPAGLRIEPHVGVYTTAFPCASLIACSWNPEVAYEVGHAGASEVKENNIAMWLTPAINIHRSPLCGRNFEYYSEDPYLTGKMAAAMVRGIQDMHISASVKHFAFNNKETNRNQSDSRVSERAAREIYLKGFEIVVKEAKPWCIMSSYNIINGHRTSECKDLITHILREEWGYEGLVTTDWWNPSEQYKEQLAGNDVKMPTGYPDRLKKALDMKLLSRDDLERSVKRILQYIMKLD